MLVHVYDIHIPPMSTVGYGHGFNTEGQWVHFAGDHRAMNELGWLLFDAVPRPLVEIEDWQILSVTDQRSN